MPIATTFGSATSLNATIPASDLTTAMLANLAVVNPAPGGGTSSAVQFTVANPTPAIAAINPASVLVGSGNMALDVTGSNLVATSVVAWNGAALTTTFVSATELKATVPAADLTGSSVVQITVRSPAPGGGTSSPFSFSVNNPVPAISAINPAGVLVGSGITALDVMGSNFVATSVVAWNGAALTTTFVSATELKATVPAADLASGSVIQITVQSPAPGGGASSPVNFTVNDPTPAILAINPASVLVGSGNTALDVTGSNFVATSVVAWNGAALTTTFVSATELKATVPATDLASSSVSQVTVKNPVPGGGTSSPANFTVNNPTPAIAASNPTSVVAGASDTPFDVTGSNFLATSVIAWNGTALSTTFVSSSELKATVPAADLAGSSASQITVRNPAPGGGSSQGIVVDVNSPIPTISGISPRNVPPGMAAMVTISGSGFEANSVALWNGSARPTTFVSSTTLQVALSASDLQNQGTGSLSVSNPAPAASMSSPTTLTVTSLPVPAIQSVTIAAPNSPVTLGVCPQLQVTVTGQNFAFDSTIQANGVSVLPTGGTFSGNVGSLLANLPSGFISAPGALSFTVTNPDGGPIVSNPFTYPATSPAAISLCATPSPTTVFPASSFSFAVQPSEVNVGGSVTLTLGALPTGITWANTSVPLPTTGATVHLQASGATAAGTYDIGLNAAAGGTVGKGDFNFTLSTGTPPGIGFASPLKSEVGVPIGGSGSIQFQSLVNSNVSVDFDITPSVNGLPAGTTAAFAPASFMPGQSVTVTLTAASSAPVTQNATVELMGTPSVPIANATANFFADVTQPPGSLPGNRSDFVSTAGTPYAAVYDATRNLIFSSNPSWNRVDVISNATHKIIKSIPVRSPRWLDLTQDSSTVWVQTTGINIYAINTTSLQSTQHSLPRSSVASGGLYSLSDRVLALSDGTLFIYFDDAGIAAGGSAGIWSPQTGQMNVLVGGTGTGLGVPVRSGDGTVVYAPGAAAYLSTGVSVYKVSSKTFSTINSGTTLPIVAVNQDGSRLILDTGFAPGGGADSIAIYDQNVTLIGTVPGTLASSASPLNGGILFSEDGKKLYELGGLGVAGIITIDATSLNVIGTAPAEIVSPVNISGANALAVPFAIDTSGIVLGRQNYGISFDDATFVQTYAVNQPAVSGSLPTNNVFAGPLEGGTVFSPYLFPDLIPDVWFGETRGSAVVNQQLSVTSPPSAVAGPVNIKLIFPDGEQIFAPQFFTYSTFPQYALFSGSAPSGGAAGQILGHAIPLDASGGTVTVGSSPAVITTQPSPFIPFGPEPFPSTILGYALPPGTPGFADLTVTTPIGTGTLPKAIYYAKSVTDYSSTDTFNAVLVDEKRKQVYVSAGDHIDVFSTASNQFVTPLTPAAIGAKKQFAGLALTPDGSQLLAADLMDGSLAVINPDAGTSIAIPIAAAGPGINGCEVGPLFVAATSTVTNMAFVAFGSLPASSCAQSGAVYLANLTTHAVTSAQCSGGVGVDATGDGNFVAIGNSPCIYSVQSGSYTVGSFPFTQGGTSVAISADGNVLGANHILGDSQGNMLGSPAQPLALYGSPTQSNPPQLLINPRFNAAGSLYFLAYPNYFEIVDVPHATLRMRFALTETVQNAASPIAIDSGGQFVYLITNQGLTVVDLGAAPLSIGHLSPQNAAAGTQVTLRGSGFDSTITATVGGIAAFVSITDENTLVLAVPAASSGPEDIVLTRGDGATYTFENGVVLP